MAEYMPYIWLVTAVILGIVEVSTAQLVSIWFVISAVITSICSATFLHHSIIWQVVVFVFVSALCLILTRPILKKIRKTDKTKTNSDRYIGKSGKVIKEINWEQSTGLVEVDGARWSAKSSDNTLIKADTIVKIVDIQGVKLVVTPETK